MSLEKEETMHTCAIDIHHHYLPPGLIAELEDNLIQKFKQTFAKGKK